MQVGTGFSFLQLFTTSGDVLCLKFGWVWETLWIFKVARWTCDRCMKINKSPTVSNGVGASAFKIWTVNLAQLLTVGTLANSRSFIFGVSNWKFCKVGYPMGTPKPDIQMWIFQNLLDIQEHCIRKLGKIRSELKLIWCLLLIFKVVYRDHLTQLLPFAWDFVAKGQRLAWGQVG